jgi:hypothetical protein
MSVTPIIQPFDAIDELVQINTTLLMKQQALNELNAQVAALSPVAAPGVGVGAGSKPAAVAAVTASTLVVIKSAAVTELQTAVSTLTAAKAALNTVLKSANSAAKTL